MGTSEPSPPTSTSLYEWLKEWRKPAVILSVVGLVSGGMWTLYTSTREEPIVQAQQVQACIDLHKLDTADDDFWVETGTRERVPFVISRKSQLTRVIASCVWPPKGHSDPDGYSQITLRIEDGPGRDEASGASAVDRITAPCSTLRLTYTTEPAGGGDREFLDPFMVKVQEVVSAWDGEAWTGRFPLAPERDQVLVVRNWKVFLEEAECVEA